MFSLGGIIYFLITGKTRLLYIDILQKKEQEILNELSEVNIIHSTFRNLLNI